MLLFFLAYIVAAILARPDWGDVLKSIIMPQISGGKTYYIAAVGILGTTITPYLFFWQVKEELEDRLTVREGHMEARHEDELNAPGFIFSQFITLFIIIAAAAAIHDGGGSILTAADAAKALQPVAGKFAVDIFAIGIIGAGLLAIPVLAASTATVVAETAKWKHESLNDKVARAKGFYTIITLSLLAGVTILVIGIDPLKAMYYSQVLAGILAVPLMVLIYLLTNDRKIMGEYMNGWFDNLFGILAIVIMAVAVVLMFV